MQAGGERYVAHAVDESTAQKEPGQFLGGVVAHVILQPVEIAVYPVQKDKREHKHYAAKEPCRSKISGSGLEPLLVACIFCHSAFPVRYVFMGLNRLGDIIIGVVQKPPDVPLGRVISSAPAIDSWRPAGLLYYA